MHLQSSEVELLSGLPLFSHWRMCDLHKLVGHSQRINVEAGTDLTQQAASCRELCIIVSGRARITRHAGEPLSLGPGDCLEEIALRDCARDDVTVVAEESMVMLRIDLAFVVGP
jgi:CRP-like cAMP-binding protein